mmetsp:Transcript_68594/g.174150  ORF Transcript_68594/g.174150 Transcript_68594/m.174150 type:complete len:241 (-) Transcript_68594:289-1011(-)
MKDAMLGLRASSSRRLPQDRPRAPPWRTQLVRCLCSNWARSGATNEQRLPTVGLAAVWSRRRIGGTVAHRARLVGRRAGHRGLALRVPQLVDPLPVAADCHAQRLHLPIPRPQFLLPPVLPMLVECVPILLLLLHDVPELQEGLNGLPQGAVWKELPAVAEAIDVRPVATPSIHEDHGVFHDLTIDNAPEACRYVGQVAGRTWTGLATRTAERNGVRTAGVGKSAPLVVGETGLVHRVHA